MQHTKKLEVSNTSTAAARRHARSTKLAHAIALTLATSGVAHAQQAFSPAWFSNKGAAQSSAAATGRMPNGQAASSLTQPRQQRATEQAQRSINNLNLAARAIAAQQAAQAAARQAALSSPSDIPDGLTEGGLEVDTNSLTAGWLNAQAPVQTVVDGRTQVTIEQTGEKAILNWETFNVGTNTTVNFEQQATWTALNRVNDPQARPSQIAGQIKADGAVYIINRNGIIFTGSSQINTASLTASALNIADDKFQTNFISTNWDPNASTFQVDNGFVAGAIHVQAGAQLEAAKNGRIVLLGGDVRNDGTLRAKDGQVLLGASQSSVYLAASDDPAMRGLRIEVGGVGGVAYNGGVIDTPRGNVTLAGRDVTLGALDANGQHVAGVLTATTTVTANGSVTLKAGDQAIKDTNEFSQFFGWKPSRTGTVSIEPGAIVQVLPELTDTQTVATDALLSPSRIDVQGMTLHVGSGAMLQAPGGELTLSAFDPTSMSIDPFDDSQIYIDQGAILDASGTRDVALSVLRNFVQVELRGAELADNPVAYDALYGKKVWVDIRDSGFFDDPLMQSIEWIKGQPGAWQGSPLFNASGYIGLIQRGVGELTSAGGNISIESLGDVIVREGSQLNVSGGTLNYAGAMTPVSYVVDQGGRFVPVGQAEYGQRYHGIAGVYSVDHVRWGRKEHYANQLIPKLYRYEAGYTEGQAAGTVSLVGHRVASHGDIFAVAEAGERQQREGEVPVGGTLIVGANPVDPIVNSARTFDHALASNILIQQQRADGAPAFGEHLSEDAVTVLSAESIEAGGIGQLEVYSNGAIVVDESVNLDLGTGGGLELGASNITVDGDVHAAGGSITLHADKTFGHAEATPTIAIGSSAVLDTAGQWTNAYADGAMPGIVDGGTVSLLTQGVQPASISGTQVSTGAEYPAGLITLADGAVIDVSGGGRVDRSGTLTQLGDAGSITIGSHRVELAEGVDLRGYALATQFEAGRGGSLTLIGAGSVIGGAATTDEERRFAPEFFRTGGFNSYSFDGVDSLTLEVGTQLVLAQSNRLILDPRLPASGTALADLGELTTLAEGIRPASSLTLRAGQTVWGPNGTGFRIDQVNGSLLLGSGSLVDVGIGGSFAAVAPEQVVISGTVRAPGGSITAGINVPTSLPTTTAVVPRAVWLTEEARLMAHGAFLPTANIYGQHTGQVLGGGTVKLDAAAMGYVVTEAGSLIDVSGAVAQVDVPDYTGFESSDDVSLDRNIAPPVRNQTVWSNAGSVVLTMRDGGYLDGDIEARAAHEAAADGRLSVLIGADASNTIIRQSNTVPNQRTLIVGQDHEPRRPEEVALDEQGRITRLATTDSPQGSVYVSADSVAQSGAGSLQLAAHNVIAFQSDVDLSLSGSLQLQAGTLRVDTLPDAEAARVNLSAAHVSVGATDEMLLRYVPATVASSGSGEINISASQLLSFGGRTVLANVDSASFKSAGDLRFDGALVYQQLFDSFGNPVLTQGQTTWGFRPIGLLSAAGDLTFGARQLYPGISTSFTVQTSGEDATLSILPGDTAAALPLSAGGRLTMQAANIVNAGVLRAPAGQIKLDAGDTGTVTLTSGSLIDVSAHGRKLPYGTVINGNWYIDYGTVQSTSTSTLPAVVGIQIPPGKQVTLSGESIDIQSGAIMDLSGGGDVTAYEFTPGTGGSRNVLQGAGVYAIVPGVHPGTAPMVGGSDIRLGESIYLSGVPGLADGHYTLLPPQYALLPGAFRVSLTGASDQTSGLVGTRNDGSYLVSGWRSSTVDGSREARNSTWLVMPGAVVREYSEFAEVAGDTFFPQLAAKDDSVVPPLVRDAGQLVLNAANALNLEGRFNLTAGEGGRGGLADIASSSIAVVADGAGPVEGYALTIEANALNTIGAQSLMLGGTRVSSREGQSLTPVSDRILVANDSASALVGPEVLLLTGSDIDNGGNGVVDTGAISIADGAVIRAQGNYVGNSTAMSIGNAAATSPTGTGMGSLLVVSNAKDLLVERHDIAAGGSLMAGSIDVRAGASLTAQESILFDATATSVIDEAAEVRARSLEIASSMVSFGAAPAGTGGFIATPGTLAALSRAERLVLRSYGSIDFYDDGSFDLRDPSTGLSQVKELVLDGGALLQHGSGDIAVSARTLTLRNTSGSLTDGADPSTTQGSLLLDAERLQIAAGTSQLLGFTNATLAAGHIEFQERGSLSAGGMAATNVTVASPLITTANAADHSLTATGALRIVAGAHARPADSEVTVGNGGTLKMKGATVDADTQILLPAGVLTLEATGALNVSSSARLDVSGRDQTFFDQTRTLPAGNITLISQTGDVLVRSGALLDLSDPKGGGKLTVTVPQGSFTIEGEARGGSFALDAGSLPGFGAMQAVLNEGGFAASRSVRLRSGDALIDGVTRTRDFSLSTDEGGITVSGTIDASGKTGGRISLSAADDIVLLLGSKLSVVGENFDGSGKGGSVFLSAGAHRIVNGQDVTNHNAVVDIQAGSLIDLGVANAAAAAKVVSLDAVGSSVALPAANSLGFPDGTPADTMIVSSVPATIVYADGTTAPLAADTPVSLPKGAVLKLSAAGTVSVASGGGKVAVMLPTTGAFATSGATTVSSVPVMLNAPGSTISLAGGTPVILPNGTPGDDIVTTTADSVSITTVSAGSQVTITAGTSSLELSTGSSITVTNSAPNASFDVGDDPVKVVGGSAQQGTTNSVVTLTRAGTSTVATADTQSWVNGLTFHQGLPPGSTVRLEDPTTGAAPSLQIYQPGGVAGTQVTLTGNGQIWFPNASANVAFLGGSPAGATLSANQAATVYAPDGSTTAVAAGQPFVVPAGGSVRLAGAAFGSGQITVSGNTTPFQIMLDNRNYTGASIANYELRQFATTQFDAIAPQTRLQAPNAVLKTDTDIPLSVTLSGAWNVNDVTLAAINAGTQLNFARGGQLVPIGSGELALNLGSGAQYTASNAELGRLAAGTVLQLGQDGRLDFVSGTAGAVPVLVPAGVRFASSGASVFDLGGGQAGTLHLRAPQIDGGPIDGIGLGIAPINGTILGAASIIAEGYKVYDLTSSNGLITSAVQEQVRTDAAAFATHTAAIKDRLLANNPGLSSVLSVAPGAEIINTNAEAPGHLTAQLGANGNLGLPANTTITLPNGLSEGRLVGPETVIDVVIPADGARISLATENYITLPAGVPITFPEGSSGGTTLKLIQGAGTLIEPDGTTRIINSGGTSNYTLLPGSVVILGANGVISARGNVPLIATLPAGAFTLRNASFLSLPAGTSVKTTAAGNLSLQAAGGANPAPLAMVLPTGSNFVVNGVSFDAAVGGSARLTLATPQTDSVSLAAGASLQLPSGGSVRVSAAGTVYAPDGSVVASFNADEIVTVAAGNTLRLDGAGTVTTQQANLAVAIAGAGYTPASPSSYTQLTLINSQSAISGTAGARVTMTSTNNFTIRSTVAVTVYRANGTVRATIQPNVNASISNGETLQLSAAGTITLMNVPVSQTVKIAAVVREGSFQAVGTTGLFQIPTSTAVMAAPNSDVRLPAAWDLADYRFGADRVPGILTLRAAGDVVLDASLSDGFAGGVSGTALLDDRSWSYRLVGGADFAAADVLAVRPEFQLVPGKGNVIVNPGQASNTRVRTGTGSIDVAAGRDIELRSVSTSGAIFYSGLYTAGRPGDVQPGGGSFSTLADGRVTYSGGSFTLAHGGGDISLTAQRDIVGAARDSDSATVRNEPQDFSDWVLTQGETNPISGLFSAQPAWGTAFASYEEGAATLGGGNIEVSAGRDLLQLNLAAANSGVYVGGSPQATTLQTFGGGDVSVSTGRDVLGSQIYVAQGAGTLNVGRDLGALQGRSWLSAGLPGGPTAYDSRLALGDASFDVVTRGDAELAGVFNPTLTYDLTGDNGKGKYTYLSTYTDRSAVSVASIAGDVWLSSNPSIAGAGNYVDLLNGPRFQQGFTYTVYPGTVEAVSFTGDLKVGSTMASGGAGSGLLMAPARDGDLTLLAAHDVLFPLQSDYDQSMRNVLMSDADPSVLLTPTQDLAVLARALLEPVPGSYPGYDRSRSHSASLYRAEDANPVRIYAVDGDIVGAPFQSSFGVAPTIVLPKPAQIRAGRDIIDLALLGQHFSDEQTTVISAGRDFREKGNVVVDGWPEGNGIWIGGPGRLEMSAGRHFDLARSAGIQTVGDQLNAFLPDDVSADIALTVGAGASGPDYAGFAAAYLDPASTSGRHNYAAELLEFVRKHSGDDSLDQTEAWARFGELPEGLRNAFVREIYFKELARVGTEGITTGNYNAGYDAVATLFPKQGENGERPEYSGDLSLRYSQIKSWYDGSIDLLVPGGGINGGVAVVGPDISQNKSRLIGGQTVNALKTPNQLGIVALRGGDINIMAYDDVIVNQSRVFAIGGGDLVVWSSEGDINAGKGAKTAVLAPPPRLVFNPATGGFSLEMTGAATGSGLATLITEPGQEPGDVWLMAPHGTVDAGDAGIRVSGNLIVAAQEVRGVDNIEVEGLSFGVPTNTVNVSALTDASAAAAQAATSAQDVVQRERAAARQALPSVFTVRVLGFGGDIGEPSSSTTGARAQPRYNPDGVVQVLGAGALTEAQQRPLNNAEQRALTQ